MTFNEHVSSRKIWMEPGRFLFSWNPPAWQLTLGLVPSLKGREAHSPQPRHHARVRPVLEEEVDVAWLACTFEACNSLEPAGCIFVQSVETPALDASLPVLFRGLNDTSEEVRRTCCLVVGNMCKLVEDLAGVLPLMCRREPPVKSATEDRRPGGAWRCGKGLQIAAEGCRRWQRRREQDSEGQGCAGYLRLLSATGPAARSQHRGPAFAGLAATATIMRQFDVVVWKSEWAWVRAKMEVASKPVEEIEEKDTEGVVLYQGSLSWACGNLTLLRVPKMHLKRNRFYDLLGPNQCGKTTLMRAIANEQLQGFLKLVELKNVFVEREIEEKEVGPGASRVSVCERSRGGGAS